MDDDLKFSASKKLKGERNADSVLFNLDDLVHAEEEPPASRSSSLRTPTQAGPGPSPSAAGSGLIDLKSLLRDSDPAEDSNAGAEVPSLAVPRRSALLASEPQHAPPSPPTPTATGSVVPIVAVSLAIVAVMVAIVSLLVAGQ